ncbi:MAG: FISUMP domain-containing protein, partial [Bacteroidota bacterium]
FSQSPGDARNIMVISEEETPIRNIEDLEKEIRNERIVYGEMTDSRGGVPKRYKTMTVVLSSQSGGEIEKTWLAENLDYEMAGSYIFENNPSYSDGFGRLYTFEAAKQACPQGWHLPTHDEWMLLAAKFGGKRFAGGFLKAGGISDFSAQFGGRMYKENDFKAIGKYGSYWGVAGLDSQTPVEYEFTASNSIIVVSNVGNFSEIENVITQEVANSCRCVKDDE